MNAGFPNPDPLPREDSAVSPLAHILHERIKARGPISFAEFMETCLYHPDHGYYTRPRQSAMDDYYTSVDVHPIFGRLLARQLAEMWEHLGKPAEFTAVECGAGVGRLAGQILDFSQMHLPGFCSALRYVAVERSAQRRSMLTTRLAGHVSAGRLTAAEDLPARIAAGCVLSNELLDALPVHRVRQTARGLRELLVDFRAGGFVPVEGELSDSGFSDYFQKQGIVLPEGGEAEVGLAACDWIARAGAALERGFVLTIDYGHEARELYDQRHNAGTLLAYFQHRAHEDYFARLGKQDLTAHVNFSALDVWGRAAGLIRLGLVSQSHFLMALGKQNEFADLYDEGMTETQRVNARLKLKSLIFPEGMGETFRVLVQAKGVSPATLAGLANL